MIETEFIVTLEDKENFYPTYENWCKARNFPAINLRQIDKIFVCFKNDVAIYSCFFWTTPSTFGVIGFPVGNPNILKEERKGGLKYLFDQISVVAERSGYDILWTTSDTPSVIESMLESGFKVADTKVDQYYKRLF